ncbi:TPA: ATPase, H+ transporting, lysosomal 14kD, V1 subunit F-like [Bos taurus]|nr:TPA: ATPase, H+ transporting, lysosomal 14kD, V1 subunit F-like [Bos taurus]
MAGRGKLIAVIRDEDTVTGFLLGGIGELNKNRHPNFLVVEKDTTINEIEDTFRQFLNRDDIGIILINQYIAEMVRHALDAHQRSIPAVLEIPSKEHPYDAAKDSILRRARGLFSPSEMAHTLSVEALEPVLPNKRSPRNEELTLHNDEQPPFAATREKPGILLNPNPMPTPRAPHHHHPNSPGSVSSAVKTLDVAHLHLAAGLTRSVEDGLET